MKSCPKCNRTFPDEGQKFCTFDGGLLIAPQTLDPNATIRATSMDLNAAAERPTSRDLPDPNATIIESYPQHFAVETPEEIQFIKDYMSEHDWFVESVYLDEEWVETESQIFPLLANAELADSDEPPTFEVVEAPA